jgi:hypothetical protein
MIKFQAKTSEVIDDFTTKSNSEVRNCQVVLRQGLCKIDAVTIRVDNIESDVAILDNYSKKHQVLLTKLAYDLDIMNTNKADNDLLRELQETVRL